MKKSLLILSFFCLLLTFFMPTNFAYAQEDVSKDYLVTADYAVVFSKADFSSDKLATLSHKNSLKILLENGAPVTENYQNFAFFKINLQENNIASEDFEFGYVLSDLVIEKSAEIVAYPNFNASTNQECVVFTRRGEEYVPTETKLAQNTPIFLYRGYEKKNPYTAVAYVVYENVEYGYLKTEVVSPNGINPVLITCAVLIVAVLGIIFAWVFMKKKKIKIK